MGACKRFGEGWLEACSRRSPSFVEEIARRRQARGRAAERARAGIVRPSAVMERRGIHVVAGTEVPVALLSYLHFERRYPVEMLIKCISNLTAGRIEAALDWAVEHPTIIGRERGWLLGQAVETQRDPGDARDVPCAGGVRP